MVFSNSCNPGPSSLTDFSSPTTPIKLSSKLENALLKNGLLSPPVIPTNNNQSPIIRKEFYSIINENYGTLQELNSTKEKLNVSLKTQNEQEKELLEVKEKVSKLQENLQRKIDEIKESQIEANKCLAKLKCSENENKILKMLIFDIKNSVGKMKVEADTVRKDTICDLIDLNQTVIESGDEIKHKISKLNEINNHFVDVINVTEIESDKDNIDLQEEDSESLHNSSTVSEHSQTSEYYCNYKPEHVYAFQHQESITPKTAPKKFIPTWLLIISAFIFFISLWIKINGSLFGQQPHLQVYYTSMPPS